MSTCKEVFHQCMLPFSSPSPLSLGSALGNPEVSSHFRILDFAYLTQRLLPKNASSLEFPAPPTSQPQPLCLVGQSRHSPKTAPAVGCFTKTSLKFHLLLSGAWVVLFMMRFSELHPCEKEEPSVVTAVSHYRPGSLISLSPATL